MDFERAEPQENERNTMNNRGRYNVCRHCGNVGHYPKYCPMKPIENKVPREVRNQCPKCKQTGHFKKNCPQLTEDERRKYNRTTRIESEITRGVADVDLQELVENMEIKLNIGQAMKLIPGLRKEFNEKTKGKRVNITTNFIESKGNSRAMTCIGQIDEHELYVIIDTGAAKSVMSKGMADELGIRINKKDGGVYTTANGKVRSIGDVKKVQVFLEGEETNIDFEILETDDKIMLVGIDWMKKTDAIPKPRDDTLDFKSVNGYVEVPVMTSEENMDYTDSEYENDEDEYEDDILEEY